MVSPVKIWRRQKFIPKLLGRKGKVVSWTIIRTPPARFKQFAPYIAGVVEFDNGQRMTGQIVDVAIYTVKAAEKKGRDLLTGASVEAVLRKIYEPEEEGIIPYGIKFRRV